MRIIFLSLIFLVACVQRSAVQAPAPQSAASPAPQPENRAQPFAREYLDGLKVAAKCDLYSGRGTAIPGDDAVLCHTATAILWCSAPDSKPPTCVLAADWAPRPEPPAPPTVPAVPMTPAGKSTKPSAK